MMGGLGCFAAASQVHFIREFLVLFAGNELCLGALLFCWFLGIVLGAAVGGRLRLSRLRLRAFLLAGATLQIVAMPLLLVLLRHWRSVWLTPAGSLPGLSSLLVAGITVVIPLAFLVGLCFPLVCRLAAPHDESDVIGQTYVVESFGAVFGGLLVGVVLAGRVSAIESILLTAMPLLIGLSWFCLETGQTRSHRTFGVILASSVVVGLALLGSGVLARADQAAAQARFEQLQSGSQRVGSIETPYQSLDLGRTEQQYSLFANGKVSATFPDNYQARPRLHLVMTQHPNPQRVLMLGSASLALVPIVLTHPLTKLDWVEIDGKLVELIKPYLGEAVQKALQQPAFQLHLTDGRRLLTVSHDHWDLIFADVPDPTTAADNRFFTQEFFELARARLRPGGVFVTRLSSSATYLGEQTASMVATVRHTLATIFNYVEVLPGAETFFLASQSPGRFLTRPDLLRERYLQRKVHDPRFDPHQFSTLCKNIDDLSQQLEARGQAELNTDARPISYLHHILRWSHLSEDALSAWIAWLAAMPAWLWFLGLYFPVLLLGLGLWFSTTTAKLAQARGAQLGVAITGAAGLSLELVLTFAYQAQFGTIYQEIGLIIAAFMLGLVGGGIWANRSLTSKANRSFLLAVVLLLLSLGAACLPALLHSTLLQHLPPRAGQVYLLLLVAAIGSGTGIVFPLASQIVSHSGRSLSQTAGSLDALDHVGAALGALLTGVLLVPLLGRDNTCFLLAGLLALTALTNLGLWSKSRA